ncbi:MAG: type II secretion system protein M [Gammaproteobacteria bacterium]|nr:type II secretion system protein M [Gammaproteobacteria bacterium]
MIAKTHRSSFLEQLSVGLSKINQRSKRERALMLAVGFAFMVVVWNVLFHRTGAEKRQAIQKERANIEQQLPALRLQINTIIGAEAQATASPDFKKKEILASQIREVDAQFKKLSEQILSRSDVSLFLEKILRGEGRLKVIELSSQSVEPLLGAEKDGLQEKYIPYLELASVALYKYPLSLVLEGGYLDTLAFLEKIQKLTWRVFWDELDYQVVKYPVVRVTVKFHTLSEQKGRGGI